MIIIQYIIKLNIIYVEIDSRSLSICSMCAHIIITVTQLNFSKIGKRPDDANGLFLTCLALASYFSSEFLGLFVVRRDIFKWFDNNHLQTMAIFTLIIFLLVLSGSLKFWNAYGYQLLLSDRECLKFLIGM